uniref:Uncharacterized protein n=1 Tax=Nelumbo nucifera TaxID=4432 RepID=A0A822Z1A3_NELNU|nr:TPA_asm: hypothetical protein HUJ06_005908 [Nelumbo nucifera]
MVPSSDAVNTCQVVRNSNGCDLASCRQWCFKVYHANGFCYATGFASYRCVCIYNCN